MPELTGSLSSFELTKLVRFVCSLGKSGDLLVSRGHWIGQLSVDNGHLTAAAVEDEQGPAALELMSALMRDGDFEFSEGPPSLAANIVGNADPVVLLERAASATPAAWLTLLPAPTDVPRLVQQGEADDAELAIDRAAIYMLLAVDGSTTVRGLAARHGLLRGLKSLVRLRELRLITFEPQRPSLDGDPGGATRGRPFARTGRLPEAARDVAPRLAATLAGWQARLTRGRPFAVGAELAQAVVFSGALILGIRAVVQNFRVEGTSMQPNFAGGQALVVNRLAYFHIERTPLARILPTTHQGSTSYVFGGPQRGDVVVFRAPPQPDTDYIKRIIGMPGETILISGGQVSIDGQRLDEPYVKLPATYNFPTNGQPAVVPDGNYFVLGDNRPDSFDSHLGWFVPVDNLIGRAWLRYWPPDELSVVQPNSPALASTAVAAR